MHAAIIIGAGFAGIGMGIALRDQGIDDFIILERSRDVGGVWRDNTYPGLACDVPSHLYSFSFEPNPHWTHSFARQSEILGYLQHCARKYDLLRRLRFGSEVRCADYDETRALWNVTLADGYVLRAQLLISAVGQLSRPVMPRLPGIDSFAGRSFHSSNWDHDYDLRGKRVAVIGTGASAIQIVPAIAHDVASLKVFQRSAAYLLPRRDRRYSALRRRVYRALPALMRAHRLAIYLAYESRAIGFTRIKALMQLAGGWPFRRMLATQVADAGTRARLTPHYPVGCKRILLSSDYLPTFNFPHVELHTQDVRRIVPTGVETVDGHTHEVDAIVYATGFAATEFLAPMRIRGRHGVDLNSAWSNGAAAYLGVTVPEFPNLFLLYGPNTNLGHNSIVYMLECQIAHVMRCVRALNERQAAAIEVQPVPFERYNATIRQRLAHTVWNGCTSWYLDAHGNNTTNWPGFTLTYGWLTRWGSLSPYRFTHLTNTRGADAH